MTNTGKKAAAATLGVTAVVFLSKFVGFVRDMIAAAYFGTGMEYDAFVSAYGLFYVPVLLISSCVTSTVVPLYVETRDIDSPYAADRFASNAINFSVLIGAGISVIMGLLAFPVTRLVYPGFAADKTELCARLLQIMLPSLLFVAASLSMSSLLNAKGKFIAAQLTGFPLSFAWIVATVFFSKRFGIRAIAWGAFVAGILEAAMLMPFLHRDYTHHRRIDRNDPKMRVMLQIAVPAMLSMAVNELNHLIDRSIASSLNTGDISAMNYAFRLITFALGVLSVPVNTVMFRDMSKQAAVGDTEGVKRITMESMEVLAMFVLPVIMIGCALSNSVIELVYQRGRFDTQSTLITSAIFTMYLIGLFFFALRDMFNRTFHSMKNTKTPLVMACVSVAVNIVLNLILSRFMGARGLALATSISGLVGAGLLAVSLKKQCGALHAKDSVIEIAKMLLASLIALAAAYFLGRLMPWHGIVKVLCKLVLATLASLAVYFALLKVLRVKQLSFIRHMVKRG